METGETGQTGEGTGFCSDASKVGFVGSIYCGIAEIAGNVGDAVVGTSKNASEAAQGVAGSASEAAQEVANPLNLFGWGAGLSVGAIGTVVALGVGGGLAADWLLAGGAGTRAIAAKVGLR